MEIRKVREMLAEEIITNGTAIKFNYSVLGDDRYRDCVGIVTNVDYAFGGGFIEVLTVQHDQLSIWEWSETMTMNVPTSYQGKNFKDIELADRAEVVEILQSASEFHIERLRKDVSKYQNALETLDEIKKDDN